jgi:hypothetical protein
MKIVSKPKEIQQFKDSFRVKLQNVRILFVQNQNFRVVLIMI